MGTIGLKKRHVMVKVEKPQITGRMEIDSSAGL
jgi:hypothetical protein